MKNGKHVILCIDDDPDFLIAIRTILEANGYQVVEAASGKEGLEVFKQTHPDLLIVDLMMEEIDAGTSLVTELKAAGCTAPIYMLSSVGDSLSETTDYSELGLSGIFQKPIDTGTLLATLKAKLG